MGRLEKAGLCVALGLASAGVGAAGLEHQQECFDGVKQDHGVQTIGQLPEHILNGSGCINIANTLGTIGLGASVIVEIYVWLPGDTRRRIVQFVKDTAPEAERQTVTVEQTSLTDFSWLAESVEEPVLI